MLLHEVLLWNDDDEYFELKGILFKVQWPKRTVKLENDMAFECLLCCVSVL